MVDTFEEVASRSWTQRFSSSFTTLIFAPIFIAVGFFLLRTGEVQHAQTTNALKRVEPQVKTAQAAQNGDLFSISDDIYTKSELEDETFGVKATAIKLYRVVYTWQWEEIIKKRKKRTSGGGDKKVTTYTYKPAWRPQLINSQKFKYPAGHQNPTSRKYEPLLLEQPTAQIGGYILDKRLYESLACFEPLDVQSQTFPFNAAFELARDTATCIGKQIVEQILPDYKSRGRTYSENNLLVTGKLHASYKHPSLHTSYLFLGQGTPTDPVIGDTRVEYWHIPEGPYSMVGEKYGRMIKAAPRKHLYIASELPCDGHLQYHFGHFGMIYQGNQSQAVMFERTHEENDKMYFFYRYAGFVFFVAGFIMLGYPVQVLFSWLPFLGVVWERAVFKIMQFIGTLLALGVIAFYWLKYNNFSNLTVYDGYFGIFVLLFLIFVNKIQVSVSSGGEEVYSEQL